MKILLFTCALFLSLNSYAGSLVCSGVVESVAYHGNNQLMVKLSSMNTPVFFCNPETTWTVAGADGRSMGPETCKSLFAIFLSARATKEPISKLHFDGDNVPTSCNGFQSWQKVFVRYVNY